MTDIKAQLRRAKALFNHPDIPASTVRHNVKAWVRSVRFLGDRWLLANPIRPYSQERK